MYDGLRLLKVVLKLALGESHVVKEVGSGSSSSGKRLQRPLVSLLLVCQVSTYIRIMYMYMAEYTH